MRPLQHRIHQSLNAVARVKSGIMLQHGHRLRSLCNLIYYEVGTHVPLHAQRLYSVCSDLHRILTGMKKEQVRERERCTHKRRFSPLTLALGLALIALSTFSDASAFSLRMRVSTLTQLQPSL